MMKPKKTGTKRSVSVKKSSDSKRVNSLEALCLRIEKLRDELDDISTEISLDMVEDGTVSSRSARSLDRLLDKAGDALAVTCNVIDDLQRSAAYIEQAEKSLRTK